MTTENTAKESFEPGNEDCAKLEFSALSNDVCQTRA